MLRAQKGIDILPVHSTQQSNTIMLFLRVWTFLCTSYPLGTTLASILPASLAAVLVTTLITTLATTLVTTLAASYDIRMVYILRTRKIKRNGICGNIVYDNACFAKRFFVERKVLKIAAKQGFSISC